MPFFAFQAPTVYVVLAGLALPSVPLVKGCRAAAPTVLNVILFISASTVVAAKGSMEVTDGMGAPRTDLVLTFAHPAIVSLHCTLCSKDVHVPKAPGDACNTWAVQ